jgi:hypothetical protein
VKSILTAHFRTRRIVAHRLQILHFVRAVTVTMTHAHYDEVIDSLCSQENIMGRSLHNKIYLGRTSVLASKRGQAMAALGALVSIGLVWMAFRAVIA